MSQCNFCILRRIKEDAAKQGKVVWETDGNIQMAGAQNGVGRDVFVYPPSIPFLSLSNEARKEYWVAWMMEIPNECRC